MFLCYNAGLSGMRRINTHAHRRASGVTGKAAGTMSDSRRAEEKHREV